MPAVVTFHYQAREQVQPTTLPSVRGRIPCCGQRQSVIIRSKYVATSEAMARPPRRSMRPAASRRFSASVMASGFLAPNASQISSSESGPWPSLAAYQQGFEDSFVVVALLRGGWVARSG